MADSKNEIYFHFWVCFFSLLLLWNKNAFEVSNKQQQQQQLGKKKWKFHKKNYEIELNYDEFNWIELKKFFYFHITFFCYCSACSVEIVEKFYNYKWWCLMLVFLENVLFFGFGFGFPSPLATLLLLVCFAKVFSYIHSKWTSKIKIERETNKI